MTAKESLPVIKGQAVTATMTANADDVALDLAKLSKRMDDYHLVRALIAGRGPGSRFYAYKAQDYVGDQYASYGRVRSQGICRVRRRGIERNILVASRGDTGFVLTTFGAEVLVALAPYFPRKPRA